MPIIDFHTHMFTGRWHDLLRERREPYGVQVRPDGRDEIFRGDGIRGTNAPRLFGLWRQPRAMR